VEGQESVTIYFWANVKQVRSGWNGLLKQQHSALLTIILVLPWTRSVVFHLFNIPFQADNVLRRVLLTSSLVSLLEPSHTS
jgi:hypothetical protein